MTRYAMPQPGTIASALLSPIQIAASEYENRIQSLTLSELLDEYEAVAMVFGAGIAAGKNCERVRLCRREIARRLTVRPETH